MAEYYYETICSFKWWYIFDSKLPEWICHDRYINYIIEPLSVEPVLAVTVGYFVSVFIFLAAFSIWGIILVEFMDKYYGRVAGKIYDKILWRYHFIKYREKSYIKF